MISPYNSLYTQAVAYTTYFELGEPVVHFQIGVGVFNCQQILKQRFLTLSLILWYKANRMWLSVVCILIDNDTDHHSRQDLLLYSWRFSRYSAPIHWLAHDHMTSDNETQMAWAGNIAKALTSNGKQFTITRSTVHCSPLLHVMAGISARFSNFAFVLFCFLTNHLMTGPLGNRTSSRETLRFSGNKIHYSPRDQSLSV